MKKIFIISFILINFLLINFVFAFDYTQSCTVSGSCSCGGDMLCKSEGQTCISSDTCSFSCPAPKSNSKSAGNNCNSYCDYCTCQDLGLGLKCTKPTGGSICKVSGTCEYTCDDDYTYDGQDCVLSEETTTTLPNQTTTTLPASNDTTVPLWKNQGQSNATADPREGIELYAQGYDETALDYAWLETDESGEWEIYETKNMGDASATWKWSNFTFAETGKGNVSWRIYYNDTSGNENVTDVMTFNVIDVPPDKPILNSPVNGAIDQALTVTLNVTVIDKNNDVMKATFFDASGDDAICVIESITSGTNVICEWENLSPSTTYEWYVNITDGTTTTQSYTWEFLTGESGITTTTLPVETTIRTTTTVLATTTTSPSGKIKTPLIIGGILAIAIGAVIAVVFFTSIHKPSL